MKKLILLLLFPLSVLAVSEKEITALKIDAPFLAKSACMEETFLRTCYKADEAKCFEQVKKSYDGCVKFLQKFANGKSTLETFEKKLDTCIVRDVGLQWKNLVGKRMPACALPPKEIL